MSDPSWQLHPNVHPMTVGTLLDCVLDLGAAAKGLPNTKSLFGMEGGWRVVQAAIRRISVPLRKLLLDDEGAHTNELPAWVAVGVNPEDIDRGRNMKYRLVNAVYFGCLSYPHVVALYTALHITRRMQQLLAKCANTLAGVDASSIERSIRDIRTDLVVRAQIVNASHEMIVVGRSNVPGNRRRSPVYRLWSGSPQWDAPALGRGSSN